jgi:hypothetical protein
MKLLRRAATLAALTAGTVFVLAYGPARDHLWAGIRQRPVAAAVIAVLWCALFVGVIVFGRWTRRLEPGPIRPSRRAR